MRPLLLLCLAAVFSVPDLAGWVQEQRTPPFSLAVLRRDGLAMPFAAFNGRRWSTPWPANTFHDLPITLADVPGRWWGVDDPPQQMTLWADGARQGSVQLTGVTTLRLMCLPRTVLKTNHKPSALPPPPVERPYPKDGLLVSADVPVQAITVVDRTSEEARGLVPLFGREFDSSETEATRSFSNWMHPVSPGNRKRVPITLEAVYRAPADETGWTAYYIEAVREYPPGREDKDGCGLVTFGSGWVMRGPKNEVRSRLSATVTYCDRAAVSYLLPLGLISANGRNHWVYQLSGFASEWYEVARPTPGRTESLALYHVGSCRQ